ncbi:hypothetical protein [Bacillus pseudomycoides]|uniref:hypothetical protein n=1 Tax=Bacillus pseudomycoides TaxID=64104 RepID=UPI000BF0A962|nr:hypothetical protein [Bacillus pseudomycoides]PEN09679.1 hypothetical protein CN640_11560 [Bacillus pseudomycoides]
MECNGKLLTEEQVDKLQFMIHNYYKKSRDICSCDVERVLTSNLKEHQYKQDDSLLVIEVKDMNSAPSITYKGKTITNRIAIAYEWETGDLEKKHKQDIKITHAYQYNNQIVVKTFEEKAIR